METGFGPIELVLENQRYERERERERERENTDTKLKSLISRRSPLPC